MLTIGLALGLGAYVLRAIALCFFRVEQGHRAVLSAFGAAIRRAPDSPELVTFDPGLHLRWPWQKVHSVAMMEQNLDLSGEQGGRTAMAEDGTVLRFDSILRYVPVEAQLAQFLFGLKSPLEHITGAFTCLLRNEIANFRGDTNTVGKGEQRTSMRPDVAADGGSYARIRRERRLLNARIEAFCREQLGDSYGVRFNAVDLTDILPPDELAEALNAVMQAQTEADALYAHAEADCEQRVLSAERGVTIACERARALEIEINCLSTYLGKLADDGVLQHYVARRQAEVLAESRSLYLKRSA